MRRLGNMTVNTLEKWKKWKIPQKFLFWVKINI